MMIASVLHSQDKDVITIPRADALRKLAQANSAAVYKQALDQIQVDVDTLNAWITRDKKIITLLQQKDTNNKNIISELNGKVLNYEQQKQLLLDQIAVLNKDLRKARRGLRWLSIGAITAAIAAFLAGTAL